MMRFLEKKGKREVDKWREKERVQYLRRDFALREGTYLLTSAYDERERERWGVGLDCQPDQTRPDQTSQAARPKPGARAREPLQEIY